MCEITFSEFKSFVDVVTPEILRILNLTFSSSNLKPTAKIDGTFVTNVDLEIESFIRDQIQISFPNHSILGEEFDNNISKSSISWIIDPIDGTLNLIHGVPLYGTLIGLLDKLKPTYGFMCFPQLGNDIFLGDGYDCFFNNEIIKSTPFEGWQNALILTTDEIRLAHSHWSSSWLKLKSLSPNVRTWGDCYGYSLVCQGKADVMLDVDLKPYDILPLIPILKGAGVSLIDLSSSKNYSSVIACKPEIEEEIKTIFSI